MEGCIKRERQRESFQEDQVKSYSKRETVREREGEGEREG